ncbi:Histone-lysine N-methyltransferase [Phytophthora cinnamomi]|uniref:Histone-lysine N-methyltransferase n=1 Tax=Phytophthora cinnamomi TaxID=4785 RepID=UPI00355A957B|nr:Histone-lysine N-methyltransferase [Phytophthora cinnamomi]
MMEKGGAHPLYASMDLLDARRNTLKRPWCYSVRRNQHLLERWMTIPDSWTLVLGWFVKYYVVEIGSTHSMKQLKMDLFLTREGHELLWQGSQPQTQRSVIGAYTEYEDVSQNLYICRSRKEPPEIPYCHCAARTDWRETCGPGCENRVRTQRGDHAAMGLKPIEGKGISLVKSQRTTSSRSTSEARRSQNTYGMVVTDKEVIDASYVGAIERGEEITISYGFNLSSDKENIKCLCGSPGAEGTFELDCQQGCLRRRSDAVTPRNF